MKELAKSEAEYFVKNLIDVANTNNLDAEWFVEEVVKKSTSKVKVNGYGFTRLLPPPEGSGFPPTSNERFYL